LKDGLFDDFLDDLFDGLLDGQGDEPRLAFGQNAREKKSPLDEDAKEAAMIYDF
jgi:hypothetical protein